MGEKFTQGEGDGSKERPKKEPLDYLFENWQNCIPEIADELEQLDDEERVLRITQYAVDELMEEGRMTSEGAVVQEKTTTKELSGDELIQLKALEIFLRQHTIDDN